MGRNIIVTIKFEIWAPTSLYFKTNMNSRGRVLSVGEVWMNVALLMSKADYSSSETVINQTPQRQECDGDLVRPVFLFTAVYFTRLCLNLKLRPHQRQYFYNLSKSVHLNDFFRIKNQVHNRTPPPPPKQPPPTK